MLYAKWIHGSDDISLAKAVREQVFVQEQGFEAEKEFDTFDKGAWHVVAMEDETRSARAACILMTENLRWAACAY
ncbi:MAG: hypothetical protein ACLT0Y_00855 [Christensenellales bacterium]